MQAGSVLHLCTKFEADCSIRSKVIKGPEIRKLGHLTRTRPLMGRFMVHTQGGSVLYVYTNLKLIAVFVQKSLAGSRNWVT